MSQDTFAELPNALNCFHCFGELKEIGSDKGNQPAGGTEMIGGGCYGSSVTDTSDGWKFVINICDACMKEGIRNGWVIRMQHRRMDDSYTIYKKASDVL